MGNNLTPYSISIGDENIYFFQLRISSLIKEKRIKIINCWKKVKLVLIHLIIMFKIVENTDLKNYDYIKFFQFLVNFTIDKWRLYLMF